MSKSLSIQDIEQAAQTALNNFGTPDQLYVDPKMLQYMHVQTSPHAFSETYSRIRAHYLITGLFTREHHTDFSVMYDAAVAFKNIGLDKKGYIP